MDSCPNALLASLHLSQDVNTNTMRSALVGVGQSMWQVILGRAVSGAGSSAMGVVAALLISGASFQADE